MERGIYVNLSKVALLGQLVGGKRLTSSPGEVCEESIDAVWSSASVFFLTSCRILRPASIGKACQKKRQLFLCHGFIKTKPGSHGGSSSQISSQIPENNGMGHSGWSGKSWLQ